MRSPSLGLALTLALALALSLSLSLSHVRQTVTSLLQLCDQTTSQLIVLYNQQKDKNDVVWRVCCTALYECNDT